MVHLRSLELVVAVFVVTGLAPARAQIAPPRAAADSFAFRMDIRWRDRWMHGRQQSRFTPFSSEFARIVVDSVAGGGATQRLHLTVGNTQFGPDTAVVTADMSDGSADTRFGFASFHRRTTYPGDSTEFVRARRGDAVRYSARLWDLIPSRPRGAPRVGLVWTDTIDRSAVEGPFRRSLRGTRVSRIVRDSIVDGRRLWIVRDSATVRYEEAHLESERTLGTAVPVARVASGTVLGVHALDSELALFRWRDDTTHLSGEAVLQYPDGRSFTTPARYERTQRWTLFDAPGFARYAAERRATDTDRWRGMVAIPSNALERRLTEGDATARDSLLREWNRTSDPDTAAAIMRTLSIWLRDTASRQMLDRVRFAAGDTAFLYQHLANRAYAYGPTDTADVRAMLPFMEDPSIAWGFNLSRDWLYENLVQAMTTMPRAAAAPGARASCTPSACDMLAALWHSAREPRLRDVGLVARFASDPRRWADTVLALDPREHPILRPAKLLAMGAGATWIAASKTPMPPPNSDARVWLEWMNGVDPQYAAASAGQPFARPLGAPPAPRFESSHQTAIRMYTAQTGRDIVGELQRSYRAATADTSRLVFGMMLQGLGALGLTEAEIAEAFRSGDHARTTVARRELMANLRQSGAPMSAQRAAPLIDRLIAAVVNSTPLWRDLTSTTRQPQRELPGLHGGSGRIFIESDNVSDSLRAKWAGRVEFISKLEWNRREPREGGTFYSPQQVTTWGRFARVELTLSERISRPAAAGPEGYAAGTTYYLMELNGEWVLVGSEGWIT